MSVSSQSLDRGLTVGKQRFQRFTDFGISCAPLVCDFSSCDGAIAKPRVSYARQRARRQIKNSFSLRASLLNHFHKHFPSFSRIAYLPQECNASTAHAIRGPQSDLKPKPIDCGHHCFP
jgi:hypothetical protein